MHAPAGRAAVWERQAGRIPQLRRNPSTCAPLHAQCPRSVAVGAQDLGFDLHLRLGLVEIRQKDSNLVEIPRRVLDDQQIGAGFELDGAPIRNESRILDELRHRLGRGVIQPDPSGLQLGCRLRHLPLFRLVVQLLRPRFAS